MDVVTLRKACEKRPFHAFQVVTSDSARFNVPHPEFIWIDPDEAVVVISDGGPTLVDISSITTLDYRTRPAPRRKAGR